MITAQGILATRLWAFHLSALGLLGLSVSWCPAPSRAAKLRGEDSARRIQLVLEYDPAPPFTSGSPERADPAAVEDVRQRRAPVIKAAEAAARRAAERLRP